MKFKRTAHVVLAAVMVILLAACDAQASGPPAPATYHPYCPFDEHLVVYAGDSLVAQWPRWVDLPDGLVGYNTARGYSAYSGNYYKPEDSTFGSIDRVLGDLDVCGDQVKTVVVSGGFNDISYGATADDVISAVHALDEALYERGVDAIFLPLIPVSNATPWYTQHNDERLAINSWMLTPDNMHSRVVNCEPSLESSVGSDVLAPQFVRTDYFGVIDHVHPNDLAYQTIAACVLPAVVASA